MPRVKTPTVMQMEVVECGAASLGIILGFFGRFETLERLRVECGVSRDGSSAGDLVRAAERYGLVGRGFSASVSKLAEKNFPMILLWEGCHFLVLEGIDGDTFYLNDPATGPRKVQRTEFEKAYSGICLSFSKGETFSVGGEPFRPFRHLLTLVKRVKWPIVLVTFLSVLLLVVGVAIPAFSKVFIDQYLIQGLKSWIAPLIMVMLIVFSLQFGLVYLQQSVLQRLGLALSTQRNHTFMWYMLRLPCQFFSLRSLGDLISRLESNNAIANFLSYRLFVCLRNILSVLVYGVVMFFYSWQLSLLMLLLFGVDVLLYFYSKRATADKNLQQQMEGGKLNGVTMNGLSMLESLKAIAGERAFFTKWTGQLTRFENSMQSSAFIGLIVSSISEAVKNLRAVAVIGVGGFLIVQGSLTIGGLVAFIALSMGFLQPMTGLIQFFSSVRRLSAQFIRVHDVYNYPLDVRNQVKEGSVVPVAGRVEFKQVSFGYRLTKAPLIENFNLVIEPGERVALVGLSGSGKSTLAKLLTGLYQPWSGEILLDGKPLANYSAAVLAQVMASVDQDIFMFEGSLRENLSLWRDTISDSDLMKALAFACVDADVMQRPDGLATHVGEGGQGFSGGQLQRFEIARALLLQPAVLILDEATSALDPLVEKRVDENLRQLGAATLIVAHRLSTVRDADKILVLENGKVVESGSHDSLMVKKGAYFNMMAKVA